MNRERAAGYVSQALDFQMRGNMLKSAELLGRAFDLNPALGNDPLASNLAADLTGQGPSAAARTFLDRNARAQFIASKGGRAVSVSSSGAMAGEVTQTGWGGAFLDLLIYGLAAGALTFIILMVAAKPLVEFIVQAQQAATSNSQLSAAQQQLIDQQLATYQGAATLAGALPLAITTAIGAIIGLLIEAGIEHLIVKTAMGGSGLLTSLIHKLAFLQIIIIAVGGVVFIVFVLVLLPQLELVQAQPNSQPNLTLFWLVWAAAIILGIVALYYRARLIARNYGVNWFRGCVTIILYAIVVLALQLCLSATVGGLLGNLFNGGNIGMRGTF